MSDTAVRRPAFQFYPGEDLLLDRHCILMDVDALGAHMRLYAHAWERVVLPLGIGQLAKLAGVPNEKKMRALWEQIAPAWTETPEGWRHPGLDAKRAKLDQFVDKQRANGARGGRPRGGALAEPKENPEKTQAFSLGSGSDNPHESSSSSSSTSSSEENPPVVPPGGTDEGSHDAVRRVFAHWQTVSGKPRVTLTDPRLRPIRARLKHFSEDQLCAVIDSAHRNPFYLGTDPNSRGYCGYPETIFKNDAAVERHLDWAEEHPTGETDIDDLGMF